MSITKVGDAIQRMDDHRGLFSEDAVNVAITEILIGNAKKVGTVLNGAMSATVVTQERVGKPGHEKIKKVTRPDHLTRLRSVEIFKTMVESIRPKGGGVTVAVQQNNNGNGNESAKPAGNSFEERIRRIRSDKGMANNDEIIDAEFAGPSTLQDELADFGIDLEDEDEDEDDDVEDEEEDGDGARTP